MYIGNVDVADRLHCFPAAFNSHLPIAHCTSMPLIEWQDIRTFPDFY